MDAEGFHEETPCPACGSAGTVTYRYAEGFTELECPTCGYRSDADDISDLTRYRGDLLEGGTRADEDGARSTALPPVPIRVMKA